METSRIQWLLRPVPDAYEKDMLRCVVKSDGLSCEVEGFFAGASTSHAYTLALQTGAAGSYRVLELCERSAGEPGPWVIRAKTNTLERMNQFQRLWLLEDGKPLYWAGMSGASAYDARAAEMVATAYVRLNQKINKQERAVNTEPQPAALGLQAEEGAVSFVAQPDEAGKHPVVHVEKNVAAGGEQLVTKVTGDGTLEPAPMSDEPLATEATGDEEQEPVSGEQPIEEAAQQNEPPQAVFEAGEMPSTAEGKSTELGTSLSETEAIPAAEPSTAHQPNMVHILRMPRPILSSECEEPEPEVVSQTMLYDLQPLSIAQLVEEGTPVQPFPGTVTGAKFVRVEVPGGVGFDHYVVGVIPVADGNTFFMAGFPVVDGQTPDPELKGYTHYLPSRDGGGYWVKYMEK